MRSFAKDLFFRTAFASPVRKLMAAELGPPPVEILDRLIRVWRNPDYVADLSYLCAVWQHARTIPGPILECGSGLTTLVLLAMAARGELQVCALENHPSYHAEVVRRLTLAGLPTNNVLLAPLRSYGQFDWYDLPEHFPSRFGLVVCDGPSGDTRGGRSGLLPACHERLRGAAILLDDVDRPSERELLQTWQDRYAVTYTTHGKYAVCRL